jgi:hypothetical protein
MRFLPSPPSSFAQICCIIFEHGLMHDCEDEMKTIVEKITRKFMISLFEFPALTKVVTMTDSFLAGSFKC